MLSRERRGRAVVWSIIKKLLLLEVLVDLAREQDTDFDRLDSVTTMTDFAVAGRYPESDQWIDDCDPSEWMAIVQQACDFVWQKIEL